MTEGTSIEKVQATGPELWEMVSKMCDAVADYDSNKVMLAACALAVTLQNPNLTPEELKDGTQLASNTIAMFFSNPQGVH